LAATAHVKYKQPARNTSYKGFAAILICDDGAHSRDAAREEAKRRADVEAADEEVMPHLE